MRVLVIKMANASTQCNYFYKNKTTEYVQCKPECKDKKIMYKVESANKCVQYELYGQNVSTQCISEVCNNEFRHSVTAGASMQTGFDELSSVHEKILYILRTVPDFYDLQYEVITFYEYEESFTHSCKY